jgi:peptidoglycan hydrolase-like protein with peptidoglycan-binding domain
MGLLRLLALLLPLLLPTAAAAQAAMAYSEPDDSFGWCASQNSAQDAVNCARIQCIDAKGADCQIVLECRGGWLSIAIGNPGYGMVCERSSDFYARQWALFTCMMATHRRCTTFDTVNDSNGRRRSAEENAKFDRAWYTQAILAMGDYEIGDVDGVIGPQSRRAIREFQEDRGLPTTGEPDDETFAALIDAVGGDAALVAMIIKLVEFPDANSEAAATSAYSAGPGGPADLSPPPSQTTNPPVAGDFSCVPDAPGFKLPGQGGLAIQDYIDKAAGGDKEAFKLLCNLANGGDPAFANAVGVALSRRGDSAAANTWFEIAGGGRANPGEAEELSPEERAKLTDS